MNCPKCNDYEVYTSNKAATGKKKDQPNLCKDCRFGTDNHKKMAKPKPR